MTLYPQDFSMNYVLPMGPTCPHSEQCTNNLDVQCGTGIERQFHHIITIMKYASNVNCLCVIQRKVVRLICNADRLAHTNELFKELYILKFPEFVLYNTAIIIFNLFHGTLPIHWQNRVTRYSTTRSTRCSNTFVMVQARTNIKAMCLSVHGVKLWNSLSTNLRDCNSVIIFKKNLKK